jgi:hypothetical protein
MWICAQIGNSEHKKCSHWNLNQKLELILYINLKKRIKSSNQWIRSALQLYFFLKEQTSNVHHSIEVSLRISTNKLQERIQPNFYQITRPYPISREKENKIINKFQKFILYYSTIRLPFDKLTICRIRYDGWMDCRWVSITLAPGPQWGPIVYSISYLCCSQVRYYVCSIYCVYFGWVERPLQIYTKFWTETILCNKPSAIYNLDSFEFVKYIQSSWVSTTRLFSVSHLKT